MRNGLDFNDKPCSISVAQTAAVA